MRKKNLNEHVEKVIGLKHSRSFFRNFIRGKLVRFRAGQLIGKRISNTCDFAYVYCAHRRKKRKNIRS